MLALGTATTCLCNGALMRNLKEKRMHRRRSALRTSHARRAAGAQSVTLTAMKPSPTSMQFGSGENLFGTGDNRGAAGQYVDHPPVPATHFDHRLGVTTQPRVAGA